MKAGVALLDEDEKRTKKRRSLEFLVEMDRGAGVSRAEFLLAILEQQGVIDAERDIEPWNEVNYCVTYYGSLKQILFYF